MNLGTAKYNLAALPSASPDASSLNTAAVTTPADSAGLSASNPMVWLVALGAATLGLVSFSTSASLVPLSASVKF